MFGRGGLRGKIAGSDGDCAGGETGGPEVLVSRSFNLYENLALEEQLLNQVEAGRPYLLFWQASDAVVLGRFQNPWKELLWPLPEGVVVGRRISGGGTVYQDCGNTNYSFIAHADDFSRHAQCHFLRRVLQQVFFDIDVWVEERGDLTVGLERKKVSGLGLKLGRAGNLHHGTLLLASNLGRLQQLLTPRGRPDVVDSKGVASRPATVTNLCYQRCSYISHDSICRTLAQAFYREMGGSGFEKIREVFPVSSERSRYHASWEWIYGSTPPFVYSGGDNLRFPIIKGLVHAPSPEYGAVHGERFSLPFRC